MMRASRGWIAAGCVLLSFGCVDTQRSPEPEPDSAMTAPTAFVGVNVMSMVPGSDIAKSQTVLVRNGTIVSVGADDEVQLPDEVRRVAAVGKYLMPGLTDAHAHLEHSRDPAQLLLFLAHGVTTVRSMDGRPYILQWKREVEQGRRVGPSIITAGPILDGDPPARDDNTRVRDAAAAVAAVREQVRSGYDFVKVYVNLSSDAYHAVLEAAADVGVPVAGHVPKQVRIEEALAAGQRSIEHLGDYDALIEADDSPLRDRWHWSKLYLAMPADAAKIDAAARLVARSGVWTVPTMVQAEAALLPLDAIDARLAAAEMRYIPKDVRAFWRHEAREVVERMDAEDWEAVARGRRNRLRLVAALHGAGANLLVGTDTPNRFVVPGYSVSEELELFVTAGLTSAQALTLATHDAARFFDELDTAGTVEAGKRADLLLLDCNPLESVRCVREVAGVMTRGQWYPAEKLTEMLRPLTQ